MFGVTRHVRVLAAVILAVICAVFPLGAEAATATPVLAVSSAPKVIITEVETADTSSSDEFIELYNLTDNAIDFADLAGGGKDVWKLQFFSAAATASGNPDWSKPAASVSLTGVVEPHEYYVIGATGYTPGGLDADQTYSPRLSDGGGGLQIVESSAAALLVHDRLIWQQPVSGKTLPAGVLSAPDAGSSLQRMPADDDSYMAENGILADFKTEAPISPRDIWVAPAEVPVANPAADGDPIDSETSGAADSTADDLPAAEAPGAVDNTGLDHPVVTELLPNPASPLSDASDEFIELYNPNDQPFNLKGYTLEVGISTLHDFTFGDTVILAPLSYQAFYSADTRVSMTNTGSIAKLLDPSGAAVSQTDAYSVAGDGAAWAFDGTSWQWTTTPTPGAANSISAPADSAALKAPAKVAAAKTATAKSTKVTAKKVSGTTKTKKASTAKPKAKKAAKTKIATVASTIAIPEKTPIHTGILVAVVVAAVLYAAYEYRHDILNYIYGLRRNRAVRAYARQ